MPASAAGDTGSWVAAHFVIDMRIARACLQIEFDTRQDIPPLPPAPAFAPALEPTHACQHQRARPAMHGLAEQVDTTGPLEHSGKAVSGSTLHWYHIIHMPVLQMHVSREIRVVVSHSVTLLVSFTRRHVLQDEGAQNLCPVRAVFPGTNFFM